MHPCGHDPGEEGISSGRNYWMGLGSRAGMIPTGGKGAMGVVKKLLSLSKHYWRGLP